MASSNNLATIEPWMFTSSTIITDAFSKETESTLITKALQQSFFNNNQLQQSAEINFPHVNHSSITTSTLTASGSGSASEPETPGSKRPRGNFLAIKPEKRRSRASKRSMTTFIQADPANFRQMVQQVTGVKLKFEEEDNKQLPVSTVVVKPLVNKLQGLLPTLDTSAYLLDHQNNNNNSYNTHRIPVSGLSSTGRFSDVQPVVTEDVDYYSFSSFPTLESSF